MALDIDKTKIGSRSSRFGSRSRSSFKGRHSSRGVMPLNEGSSTVGARSVMKPGGRGGTFGSGRPAGGAGALVAALTGGPAPTGDDPGPIEVGPPPAPLDPNPPQHPIQPPGGWPIFNPPQHPIQPPGGWPIFNPPQRPIFLPGHPLLNPSPPQPPAPPPGYGSIYY